jgi:hypothetical protein
MGKFTDRYKQKNILSEENERAVASFKDYFPELASCLSGTFDEKGILIVPPFSVRLFINGGELKFCIGRKDEKLAGFGVISNPENILESIEEAIVGERVGWKSTSEQNAPY